MFFPRVTKRVRERRAKRHTPSAMLVVCLLAILSVDDQRSLRGRCLGSKNIARTRKQVDSLFQHWGPIKREHIGWTWINSTIFMNNYYWSYWKNSRQIENVAIHQMVLLIQTTSVCGDMFLCWWLTIGHYVEPWDVTTVCIPIRLGDYRRHKCNFKFIT